MLTLALLTLGDPDRVSGGYLYHRRVAEAAPRHGFRIVFLSLPSWPFPLPALGLGRLWRDVRRLRPGAVLVDSIVAGYVGLLPRSTPGAPWIAVVHQPPGGLDHGRARRWVQARLDGATYRRIDRAIATSQRLAEALHAGGVPAGRVHVVEPGVDPLAPTDPVPDLRRGRRVAFLCVANWLPRKGIHHLLEALARLPPPLATLHLVGDAGAGGRYGAGLRRRLARPDLLDRVVVHGLVERRRLAALYAGADAFVLPSVGEPYGIVYGEALRAGLPVVGFDSGSLPRLVRHEVEGLLAPPGDVDALARALERLATDEALRGSLARAAREAGERLPTWEQTAERFFGVVASALSSAG
ncbi:MAG TPA: glycosyltransferase family 4 protein [Chloroflexota bacterium]